jgi:hypothetical protein
MTPIVSLFTITILSPEDRIQDIQPEFSNIAIYRMISILKDQGAEMQINLWKARLLHSKQTCLRQLSKHDSFASRLNALQDIPRL